MHKKNQGVILPPNLPSVQGMSPTPMEPRLQNHYTKKLAYGTIELGEGDTMKMHSKGRKANAHNK